MTVSIFNNVAIYKREKSQARLKRKMRASTFREFGGGWNVIDSPVGLSTRYASVLKNWSRRKDGSQAIRFGTQYKTNIANGNISRTPHGTAQQPNAGTDSFGDAQPNAKSIGFQFRTTLALVSGAVDVWFEAVTVNGVSDFVATLYSSDGTNPVALLFTSDTLTIQTAGFKKFSFTGVTLSAGTLYWVVISDSGSIGDVEFRTTTAQGGDIASGKSDTITTISAGGLSGGLDLKTLVNIYRPSTGDIIGMSYLSSSLLSVTADGEVIATNSSFNNSSLFDQGYAQSQTGAPNGWSSNLDFVSFTEIKGSAVVCNGVDKPLEVQEDLAVRYLQDLATGSNVNVPIAKYCTTVGNYLVLAGIVGEESVIYIGAAGTVGTFIGDPAPNDGTSVDLGAYAPEDSKQITGISSFRNYLFVHFLSATIKVILGEYDEDGNHVPVVDDTLHKFGNISHNAAVPLVNDLLFIDVAGVNTIRRNVLSGEVEPDRLSELIAPDYQNQISQIPADDRENKIFAVHDRLGGQYMILIPVDADTQDKRVFVYTFDGKGKVKAWSEYNGWDFRAGTSSALGRVFFSRDTRIYQYGNEAFSTTSTDEEYSADYIGDFSAEWANNTTYVAGDKIKDPDTGDIYECLVAHLSSYDGDFADDRAGEGAIPLLDENDEFITAEDGITPILVEQDASTFWELFLGEDISFDWEMPWTDAGTRARLKRLAFLSFDTQGDALFNVDVFVDNIYRDPSDPTVYDPALTVQYIGGDADGYGNNGQNYGGSRRTRDERLWSHPVKFKIAKYRLHGATKEPLRVVSLTQLFSEGRFGR